MADDLAAGAQEIADALRSRLQRYIEAAYHLRDAGVVAERRALLDAPGAIAREAFLETTPTYELGSPYGALGLPAPIGATLDEIASWQPGVGVYAQPYRHQSEALQAFFTKRRDLIVSTGTGSGKTETFLLPIVGSLLLEAAERPASFRLSGLRAMLLYPMNALVSDQIARLRRLLGDERLSGLFRARYGRHPRFGMYTSRTPYPGARLPKRDSLHLKRLLEYYVGLEERAARGGAGSDVARLVAELRERGRWPAKDLRSFFGDAGTAWEKRLRTQAGDRELLTRHEMQLSCPDLIVTNYSMLEYMLMRPIERPIFEQTRRWLSSDPANSLILVVDEAHLYRGTAGAEVAYLIRRLQAHMGIPRERLRCILTSASLGPDDTIEADALAFADALTGASPVGGRGFTLIRGHREPRPPARAGSTEEADALALLDRRALTQREQLPDSARAALKSLGEHLGWPDSPPGILKDAARAHLYQHLHGFGPSELLIAETTGRATSLPDLAEELFPSSPPDTARRATESLLALGTYAHNGQRPLLQTRVHMLFRGLPSLWACVRPTCTARHSDPGRAALLGRLYTEPRTHCACGARVYELLAHRDCGAVFLRAYGEGDHAAFYWHEAGGRVSTNTPLQETWLIVERPLPKQEVDGMVAPIWMDVTTGRVLPDAPAATEHYRQLWRPTARARAASGDEEGGQQGSQPKFPFRQCPICSQKTPEKMLDLATRGERPFANIVHEQFLRQPPSRPFSERLPNGGRKVLLFADGRQKAARLARDLPREVEFDAFRQALAIAIRRLSDIGREATIGAVLYTAFVSVCSEKRLHFFDREFDSQKQFLTHMRDYHRYYDADLEVALSEEGALGTEQPMRYRQHLLDQLANPFYSVYRLGAMVPFPNRAAVRRLQRDLVELPQAVRDHIDAIAAFWVQALLERGAFDKGIPEHVRERVSAYARPPKLAAAIRDLERVIREAAGLSDEQMRQLRAALYDALTEQDDGLCYLKPAALALGLAFDDAWLRCDACGNFQHLPLLGRCAVCRGMSLAVCPPDSVTVAARYDYYRQPLRDVLGGARPAHLTAEEHTAQLSQRDAGAVYATTEEFELRFQDVVLGDDSLPIDVLSCTTTMEVGIDIGSLVAIGMRNIPPQRENYQQRAGRAGRRGAAISTVVSYAEGGPHDHYYFQSPEGMIAGAPRRPMLSIGRPALAKRHIRAYLLQTFFHEQIGRLDSEDRERLARERRSLFTALGSVAEFFQGDGNLSFAAFQRWLDGRVAQGEGDVARLAAAWLPEEAVPGGEVARARFVAATAVDLIRELGLIGAGPPPTSNEPEQGGDPDADRAGLLDALFDAGLLPSYAFPTDLAAFYVFGRDGDRVVVKERPQQSKAQALSEYAPGRLLVINKETYRVGGIYAEKGPPTSQSPARALFTQPLPLYAYCPICTYVRLGPAAASERCPICRSALSVSELINPPGFSPERGRPVGERDRDQEISYASGAELPLPVAPDDLIWSEGPWPNLIYAAAENRQFVTVNRGPDGEGFRVCESCGAAWPAVSTPRSPTHVRPYLLSPRLSGPLCRGPVHDAPIYLGATFRSDLLLMRCALRAPLGSAPGEPWLRDALRTTAEALALAASRVLDVDPAELSAGHRLLPSANGLDFDLYLFDTAAGGAGYAAEAGAELSAILQAALSLVEGCPSKCERSCTRCLRHYGNRFWHGSLDRRLAAQLLRYLMFGMLPTVAPANEQRQQLSPLQRLLELEGWDIEWQGDALIVRRGGRQVVVATYPALLDRGAPGFAHPRDTGGVLLRDYVAERDLPAAYDEVRRALGR